MHAWKCDETRPVPGLFLSSSNEPPLPGPGELLIRVHASGVTPSELLWYPTTHTESGMPRRNAIPGHEFSGIVEAAGDGADFSPGDEVFGMNDWFADGATAELCVTPSSMVIAKPSRLSHAEAATVPIGALTARQGLFDRAQLQPGERVLIHGGSGAVGVFAVQLAAQRGAEVLTTASGRNRDVLLQLGARQVIDYHTERFEDLASSVDVVFDTVGGETLRRSWDLLGPHGRLVTIAAQSESTTDQRTRDAFLLVKADQGQLREIASQLEAGQLRPFVNGIVSFDQAGIAYTRREPQRGCGKTVVQVIARK